MKDTAVGSHICCPLKEYTGFESTFYFFMVMSVMFHWRAKPHELKKFSATMVAVNLLIFTFIDSSVGNIWSVTIYP